MTLSKSLYTRGVQCPKALWLKKYKPEVLTPPDAVAQARFEAGNVVGELACGLFPGGREVAFDPGDFAGMAETTRRWLDEGQESIYEATFIHDGIVVMVDILRKTPQGFEIYEVKSSTELKDIYLHDVSIQRYVLESLGFSVVKSHVVHLNSDYVRGDTLDLGGLFTILDVSDEVGALMGEVSRRLAELEGYLADREDEPDIDIGPRCKKPYDCDAKAYCWSCQRNIPDYSIFNIFNLGSKKQVDLYSRGIVRVEEIPDGYEMTAAQKQKVDNWKSGETYIDHESIAAFVGTLVYPVYHLDFETFQQPVPQWAGISPYQQIPFQYSLHIEHADGRLEHREYLAKEGIDPRYGVARRLVEDIPADAQVLAYNMSFEKGVIGKLAGNFPEFADHLLAINADMKDLMLPFQKQHYVTPAMQGSYSIKYVLPALVPELAEAYKELEGVQNGGEAMNAYAKLPDMPEEEREAVRRGLLAYCKLDTLAMVKVLETLKKTVEHNGY